MLYNNQMLSVGHVPSDWLRAVIVPVFKKGVAGRLENYKPISLTRVPSRKFMLTCVLITYCIPVSMAFVDENPQPRTFLNVSMTGLSLFCL